MITIIDNRDKKSYKMRAMGVHLATATAGDHDYDIIAFTTVIEVYRTDEGSKLYAEIDLKSAIGEAIAKLAETRGEK